MSPTLDEASDPGPAAGLAASPRQHVADLLAQAGKVGGQDAGGDAVGRCHGTGARQWGLSRENL